MPYTRPHLGSHHHVPKSLYHILFTTSHLEHDPNGQLEKVRVCGTYTSLPKAKAAAHKCLFDAGYEQEWFTTFDAYQHDSTTAWPHGDGVMVYAVAPGGEIFKTSVVTTANVMGFKGNEDGKVDATLYHVLQTTIYYDSDSSGEKRETNIEGSFLTYKEARAFASKVLLSHADGLTPRSWAVYEEAGKDDADWEYGENVVVRAVGDNGENIMVSVVMAQEMESVRLMQAAMRIR